MIGYIYCETSLSCLWAVETTPLYVQLLLFIYGHPYMIRATARSLQWKGWMTCVIKNDLQRYRYITVSLRQQWISSEVPDSNHTDHAEVLSWAMHMKQHVWGRPGCFNAILLWISLIRVSSAHAQYNVISLLLLQWMIKKTIWSYFDRCLEVTLYHKHVSLSKNVCDCIEWAKQSLYTPFILHCQGFIFHCHVEL